MGWRSSEIEVTSVINLDDYDDEIMDYVEPDNIIDAMEMMDRWGYSDGDILGHMLENMENSVLLSKLSDVLHVDSALDLVRSIYHYGHDVRDSKDQALRNQITELQQRVDDLLALKTKEDTTHDTQNV
jgi:hypothetical protein